MSWADAVVIALGLALIVAELWYFLGPTPREPRPTQPDAGDHARQNLGKGHAKHG